MCRATLQGAVPIASSESESWRVVGCGELASLDQTHFTRSYDRLRSVPDTQLAVDAPKMALHRVFADEQVAAQFLVRQSNGEKAQHLALALAQQSFGRTGI